MLKSDCIFIRGVLLCVSGVVLAYGADGQRWYRGRRTQQRALHEAGVCHWRPGRGDPETSGKRKLYQHEVHVMNCSSIRWGCSLTLLIPGG